MHKSFSKKQEYFQLRDAEALAPGVLKWIVSFDAAGRDEHRGVCSTVESPDLAWQLLEELPDGIVVTSQDRQILFANKAAKKLIGAGHKNLQFGQKIVLPEHGTVSAFLDGEERSLEITSTNIRHKDQILIMSLLRDTTAAQRRLERLAQQCFTDELTKLYNRRGFLAIGQHQIESARRQKRSVVAIFADIDGLKEINDELGHKAGDQAIVDLAGLLAGSLRAEDVIARLGGDEFVILTTIEEGQNAQVVIDRLKQEIDCFNQLALRKYIVQASFGFEVIEPDATADLDEVIQRADSDMYRAKRKRRPQTVQRLQPAVHCDYKNERLTSSN